MQSHLAQGSLSSGRYAAGGVENNIKTAPATRGTLHAHAGAGNDGVGLIGFDLRFFRHLLQFFQGHGTTTNRLPADESGHLIAELILVRYV